jgi:hypothetical protein
MIMFTRTSKYEIVADRTVAMSGTLVDVGARDKILQQYLQKTRLHYLSSDIMPGHPLYWNLEEPLPAMDNAYEVIVALDVLEHVENIHQALQELLRVSRNRLFISIPNMTCLSFRLHFFYFGKLSGKYTLLPTHQGDRHRWLTSYPQVCTLVQHAIKDRGYEARQYNIVTGYDRWQRIISHLPFPPALRTYTMLFEIIKLPTSP